MTPVPFALNAPDAQTRRKIDHPATAAVDPDTIAAPRILAMDLARIIMHSFADLTAANPLTVLLPIPASTE